MSSPLKFTIGSDLLSKGLRPTNKIPRNNGYLVTCLGAVGISGVLRVIDSLSRINTDDIQDNFPFPQIFVFQNMIIVCGKSIIYEWVNEELVEKIKVPEGSTWTAVDFFNYAYMSNGKVAVIRDSQSFQYSISNILPVATAICNFNGQVIIGSPGGMFANITGVEMLAYGVSIGGGFAKFESIVSDMNGYGGGVVGGSALILSNIVNFIASGGGIVGGSSTFVVYISNVLAYGGGVAGGSATISSNIINFSGYGGGIVGGNSTFEFGLLSNSWKNYYAISWRDTPANAVKYAKQMGHSVIGITGNTNTQEYKNAATAEGYTASNPLYFYIVDPKQTNGVYTQSTALPGNSSLQAFGNIIDIDHTYTSEQIAWYESRMAWKDNTKSFPNNLANGWWTGAKVDGVYRKFAVVWDVQQDAVISELTSKIVSAMSSCEASNFKCLGWMDDVPGLHGDFHLNTQANTILSVQTGGSDSGDLHTGITHEYATFQDGMAAYYKALRVAVTAEFPGAKWIIDPSKIYQTPQQSVNYAEYIYQIKDRSDKAQLIPDMLMQEGNGTEFVDDTRIFTTPDIIVTQDMVGSNQRSESSEINNRTIASKAAFNGSWYNWFGQFGISGTNMPNFQSITDVYPRLKLIRCVPNWDNLNNAPLPTRSYDTTTGIYQSDNSYISSDIIYTRNHKNPKKIYVVWNTHNGILNLRTGEQISTIKRTDGYFGEISGSVGDGTPDVNISGLSITLKNTVAIPVDTSNNQIKGIGYIITIL